MVVQKATKLMKVVNGVSLFTLHVQMATKLMKVVNGVCLFRLLHIMIHQLMSMKKMKKSQKILS